MSPDENAVPQLAGRAPVPAAALFAFLIKPRQVHLGDPAATFRAALNAQGVANLGDLDGIEVKSEGFDLTGWRLGTGEAREVAGLWNRADGGEQARCHIPRHGLATWWNGGFDWFASICFECQNAYLGGPSARSDHRILPDAFGFDGANFRALLERGAR